MGKLLSIVIPAYNEEKLLQNTIDVVTDTFARKNIPFELIFVDDGSTDSTWKIIKDNIISNSNIRALRFSRNFGKEGAIFAGLDAAKGDCCVIMDSDLQHPPECAVEMYKTWANNGFDIIEGRKSSRGKESVVNKGFAKLFYKLLKITSGINLENASDFKLMDRSVVEILKKMPERQTFFRALSSWVGFRVTQVYFEVPARKADRSRWSFSSLFKLAVNSITSFTNIPMQIVTIIGITFFIFAVIIGVQTIYNYASGHAVEGFTTVILLLLIMGSVIMFSLGIIGLYLSKIYEEIKSRPRYIIQETAGIEGGTKEIGS